MQSLNALTAKTHDCGYLEINFNELLIIMTVVIAFKKFMI